MDWEETHARLPNLPGATRLHNPMEVQIRTQHDGRILYPPFRTKPKTRAQRLREQFKRRRPQIVEELIERDGRVCWWCGDPIGEAKHGQNKLTVEHLVALNAGGDNRITNLRLAHSRCNR